MKFRMTGLQEKGVWNLNEEKEYIHSSSLIQLTDGRALAVLSYWPNLVCKRNLKIAPFRLTYIYINLMKSQPQQE